MTNKQYRERIRKHMAVIEEAANYLEAQGYSVEAQRAVEDGTWNLKAEKIELESPENEKTQAGNWIRLNLEYCWIFLYPDHDGTFSTDREYQFDPYATYYAEVINAPTYEEFTEELNKITDFKQYNLHW